MNQERFKELINEYVSRVQSINKTDHYVASFISYASSLHATISYDKGDPKVTADYRNRIVTFAWNKDSHKQQNCLDVYFTTFHSLNKEEVSYWIEQIKNLLTEENHSCFILFNQHIYKTFHETFPFVSIYFPAIPIGPLAEEVTELIQYKEITPFYTDHKSILFPRLQKTFFKPILKEKPYLELFCYSSGKPEKVGEIHSTSDWDQFIEHSLAESEKLKKAEDEIFSIIKRYAPNSFKEQFHIRVFEQRISLSFERSFQGGKMKYIAHTPSGKRVNLKFEKLLEKVKKETETYLKKHRVKAVVAGKTNDHIYAFWKKIYGWSPDIIDFDYCFISSFSKEEFNEHLKQMVHQVEKKELDPEYAVYFKYYLRTQKIRRKITRSYEFGDLLVFDSPSKVFVYKKDEFITFDLQQHPWKNKEDKQQIETLTTWKKNLL